jgi:hypothetical protein
VSATGQGRTGSIAAVTERLEPAYGPVLGLALVIQLVGLVLLSPVVTLVGFGLGALAELTTADDTEEIRGRLRRFGLGLLMRALLRGVLLLAVLLLDGAPTLAVIGYVGGLFAMAGAARWLWYRLTKVALTGSATAQRNLAEDLPLHGFFDDFRRQRNLLYSAICAAELPLGIGLAVATLGGDAATVAGVVILAVTDLALVVSALAVWRWAERFDRSGAVATYVEQLEEAIAATGAKVVVYFSGDEDGTYQLNQWMPVLERLEVPLVILLRERWHLETLRPTRWPVVLCPRHADVEVVLAADPKVALYVGMAGRNIHFLRYARIKHVFLNHGDSDKVSSANPVVKVYDRLFVAGQIAIDRYRSAGIDLPDDRFRIIGRPQLDGVLDARQRIGEGPPTLLYAPTWEGYFEAADYSSLERSGVELIRHVLDRHPGVRIVYKPHPASGSVRPSAGAARRKVEALLRRAGGPHIIAADQPELDLLAWFDRADVLLSDISAVVTDFLATDKPYLVTNPRGLPIERFHASFPSHRAAYVVSPDLSDFDALLDDALGPDTLAAERARMKVEVLGDLEGGPFAAFTRALDEAVAWAERDASRVVNTFAYDRS